MALVITRKGHGDGRRYGYGWVLVPVALVFVLVLLALPTVMPVKVTLGQQTFYARAFPPSPNLWPTLRRWGVSNSSIYRVPVRIEEHSGGGFEYAGPVTTVRSVTVAGWNYYWFWGKGRRIK